MAGGVAASSVTLDLLAIFRPDGRDPGFYAVNVASIVGDGVAMGIDLVQNGKLP